ncbi:MAG: DUF664 domain-containing protein [Deltaproteobacteria bacterium]|nr:DUF664 domain-containing protein [Deltaproteobacteria bacterium]MBW1960355.1 DUF664 domain-containing protein [Deltaproteobacteria bacterium]MBW2152728.1 DUF664 domain-containing protein [Deltaproteobacteria bacterium]
MHSLFEDYFNCLQGLHDDIKKCIDGLPQEALYWVPGAEMNSLCVIAVHVAGSQRYWIGDIISQEDSKRDRDAEFRARGLDAVELTKRLDESLAYTKGILERLRLEDLETICVSPKDDRKFTKGWVLWHVLEHVANHLGHAQLTRQLWEQR